MLCGEYALQDVLIKEFRASELAREAAWRGETRKYPNEAQGGLREAAGGPREARQGADGADVRFP